MAAGARQVRRTREPVVTPTDDDDVVHLVTSRTDAVRQTSRKI